MRLGVLDLELGQVGHALLAVRHPPLLLHRQLADLPKELPLRRLALVSHLAHGRLLRS